MSNDANKFAQLRAVAIAAETYAELGHWPKIAPLLKEIRLLLPQCRAEMNNAKAQAKQSRTSDDITTVEAARRLNITLSPSALLPPTRTAFSAIRKRFNVVVFCC